MAVKQCWGDGKEGNKLENIHEPKQQDLGIDGIEGTMGEKGVIKNRIQWSNLGDQADISANNCICELGGVNQIEGKIIALKCHWNIAPGNVQEAVR